MNEDTTNSGIKLLIDIYGLDEVMAMYNLAYYNEWIKKEEVK